MTRPGRPVVLLVEDELAMRRFLRAALNDEWDVVEVGTAREALGLAARRPPDLVLLDLGLPDGDGIEVTARLREWSHTPIIVLSARGQEADKIAALDAGADDYLTKPFSVGELLARMRVARRHAERVIGQPEEPVFEIDGLRIDRAARMVFRDDAEVRLTPTEYKLLLALVAQPGRVLTHRQLLRQVWGSATAQTHTLRVYMAQLRAKLERDPARPTWLRTEPGVGYRFTVPEEGRA